MIEAGQLSLWTHVLKKIIVTGVRCEVYQTDRVNDLVK